jgi:hypothetical protein
METFGPKNNSGAPTSILHVAHDSKNILSWGINVLLPVMGIKDKKLKGSHLSVFKGDEWKPLGLKIILEPGRQSYM